MVKNVVVKIDRTSAYGEVMNISFSIRGERYNGASYKGNMNLVPWIERTLEYALRNPTMKEKNG